MLLQSFGRRVARLRPRVVLDGYGDPSEDWTDPERTPILHASVQHVATVEESSATRRLVATRRRIAIRGVFDLTDRDRIELEGLPWEVDGDPVVIRPRLGVPFTVAELKRLT